MTETAARTVVQKRLGRLDHVIGRHDDHRRRRDPCLATIPAARPTHGAVSRGQGSAIDVPGRQVGKLGPGRLGLVGAGDDQDPLRRHQGLDPRHGLLEHRRLAGQAEQLLGTVAAALGPEPSPAATGHDDRV